MDQIFGIFYAILNGLLIFFLGISGGVIAFVALIKIIKKFQFESALKTNSMDTDSKAVILIKIPPSEEKQEEKMEEFLKVFHRVLPNNTLFSLEMVSSNQFLSFFMVIPKHLQSIAESQLYAQFPEAEIEEVQDYIPEFSNNVAFVQLYFKKNSMSPFKTYQTQEEDLLKNLSAILAKTETDEEVFLQLSFKRIGGKFWERGMSALWYKLFGKKYVSSDTPHPAYAKLSQDLYEGKIRLGYVAKDKTTAEIKLNTLLGFFKSLKGSHNELKKKRFVWESDLEKAFKARIFEDGDFWSPSEIATVYHFPHKGTIASNVVHTTSKRAPAPDILPREGLVNPSEVSFFGETNYRNENRLFGIKRIDRRRHLYIIGKTGSGKSRLLELLFISDLRSKQGCCLIDPHGDLADELLMFVPKERVKDVVYINPSDRDFPIGFNPLEPVEDYQMRQHLATFFIAIFKKLFAANWNARMEHLIRYITLALLETPDSNILGIPRILSDTTYRQRVIMQIQDPVVKSFWTNEFSAWNEQFANDAVIPILNKVGQFIANPTIRNMVGQKENMLDFERFMNEGNIVLINLSKGKVGDENAALLGSMFITKIQQAALARAKIPEDERRDFYFYVDEFQNFATEAFSSILSEARKYHLDLTIAHQYIAQLPEEVKATAFGNVGSMVVFAAGGDDAAYLAKEFSPVFSQQDLINLNVREMYIKMSIDGKLAPPFSGRTINVPKPQFDYSVEILNNSRMTYGRNRVSVENEIIKWTQAKSQIVGEEKKEEFPEPII